MERGSSSAIMLIMLGILSWLASNVVDQSPWHMILLILAAILVIVGVFTMSTAKRMPRR